MPWIPLSVQRAEGLLQDMRTVQGILLSLATAIRSGSRALTSAATPSPAACDGCPFRPVCQAYQDHLGNRTASFPRNVVDLRGVLKSVDPQGGVICLHDGTTVIGVGQNVDDPRTGNMRRMMKGGEIAIYNVRNLAGRLRTFMAGPTTVVLPS